MSQKMDKVFNDSVHGNMEFPPLVVSIIDTPEFQRLRYLKQLGVTYFVYPGASHNRFEHCLGVCHLAGLLVKRLRDNQPDLDITEEDVLCVQIAGLCHDLGHGPFSHLFDNKFIPMVIKEKEGTEDWENWKDWKDWTHEKASMALFDHMLQDQDQKMIREFDSCGIDEERRKFIKEMIYGEELPAGDGTKLPLFYPRNHKKAFLYEIVANKRNEVDVDKMDYFARDALHLGQASTFDHMRYINFVKVIQVDGQWQICVRDKEAFNMYQMFHTRFSLHRRAYKHKTVQAVEIMLLEAMKNADGALRLSESIKDMNIYINLTDSIFHEILRSEDPGLEHSKSLLIRIQQRKLHRCVAETDPITRAQLGGRDDANIKAEILSEIPPEHESAVENLEDNFTFVVQIVKLDFGKGDENPVEKIRFFTKNSEILKVGPSAVSNMIPQERFKEHLVRLFLLPSEIEEEDRQCFRALEAGFWKWCQKNGLVKAKVFPLTPAPRYRSSAGRRQTRRQTMRTPQKKQKRTEIKRLGRKTTKQTRRTPQKKQNK